MSGENACHGSSGHAKPPDDVQHIGKYRLIRTIGRGNFAKVKLAKHVPTGRQVMKHKYLWRHRIKFFWSSVYIRYCIFMKFLFSSALHSHQADNECSIISFSIKNPHIH